MPSFNDIHTCKWLLSSKTMCKSGWMNYSVYRRYTFLDIVMFTLITTILQSPRSRWWRIDIGTSTMSRNCWVAPFSCCGQQLSLLSPRVARVLPLLGAVPPKLASAPGSLCYQTPLFNTALSSFLWISPWLHKAHRENWALRKPISPIKMSFKKTNITNITKCNPWMVTTTKISITITLQNTIFNTYSQKLHVT